MCGGIFFGYSLANEQIYPIALRWDHIIEFNYFRLT